ATGLGHVLDWEFGHRGDPAEDVAWPLVRAWRFGVDQLRLGGVGDVEPYVERYNALTGRHITLASLDYWEIVGNLKGAIGPRSERRWCGARSIRSLGFLATRTRCRRTSRTCAGGRATSTASSRCSSGRATYPRARSRIFWRRSPTSCGSRAPAISSVTAEARSLV